MQTFIVLAVVGLLAQLVDGSLGMAYGVTSTTLLLASGLPPAMASASVHLAEVGTTLLSGASHWRFGNVDWTVVRRIALPGAVGAFLGATVLSNISTEIAAPWMSALLLTLGVVVLLRFAVGRAPKIPRVAAVGRPQLGLLGVFAGFIDATGGGGWGPVATPTLLASGSLTPRKVIGSVDTSEFLVALAASAGFLLALGQEGLSLVAVGALLTGGLVAAPLAAWLVRHIPTPILGTAAGGLIILTNVRTILNALDVADTTRAVAYLLIAITWATSVAFAVRRQQRDPDAWAEPEPIAAS